MRAWHARLNWSLDRRRIRNRHLGILRPCRDVAIEVTIERLSAQVGPHAAWLAQERERLAVLAGTAVAHGERVGDKPEPIALERTAQRQHAAVVAQQREPLRRAFVRRVERRAHVDLIDVDELPGPHAEWLSHAILQVESHA